MFNALVIVLVASVVSVGLVEVVKNFLPDSLNTIVKTIIGLVIELAVGVLTVLVFDNTTVWAKIFEVVAIIAVSQLYYTTLVDLIRKLVAFLKSKITKKES